MKSETFKIELMESSHSFLSQIMQYFKKKKKKKKLKHFKKEKYSTSKNFRFFEFLSNREKTSRNPTIF